MNEVIRRHPYRRRKNPPTANTSVIESSPISLELRGAGGFKRVKLDDGRYSCRPVNVSGLLRRREFKSSSCRGGLSKSDCCTITANYLPNTKTTIKRFQSRLFGGLFSEDGTVFMSSCQDNHIRLYDVTNGQFDCFKDISAKDVGWAIVDTSYSPDQNYLIYSSWSDCIHLCNVHGDNETHTPLDLRPPDMNQFCAFSIRFSKDNNEILAGYCISLFCFLFSH
jgi:WD repeat-containing protein 23